MASQDLQRTVALALIERASPAERQALQRWAEHVSEIQSSALPAVQKAASAIRASVTSEVVVSLLRRARKELKSAGARSRTLLWDDRGWPARLGGVGILLAVGAGGSKGAGIAALGTAVGVPLWVVFGAGGTFLGTVLEELTPSVPTTSYSLVDAEKETPPSLAL